MKKTMVLLLAIMLLLACTPAMALDWKYESENLGSSIRLPDYLEVISEIKSKEEKDTLYIFFTIPETNTMITGKLSYIPQYRGLQTKDLPKKVPLPLPKVR